MLKLWSYNMDDAIKERRDASYMSDHNAMVDAKLKLVCQNIQSPYAIKPSGSGEIYVTDMPKRMALVFLDQPHNVDFMKEITGLEAPDCKKLCNALIINDNKRSNRAETNLILSDLKPRYQGIGEKLGEGGFRISIETDEAFKKRVQKQIGHLINSVEGGADILTIQEQPYKGIDPRRLSIFRDVMAQHGFQCVADNDRRDVGIWVKREHVEQFKTPDLQFLKKVQSYPYRGCVTQNRDTLILNLHMDRRATAQMLIDIKNAAKEYAQKQSPPLDLSITGDMNLMNTSETDLKKLETNGFSVDLVKGITLDRKVKSHEAFYLSSQDAPRDENSATSSMRPGF